MNPKILIVDDASFVREIVKNAAQRQGWKVIEGEDGFSAIRLAAQEEPDVIIMDIVMPGLNGFQAAKEILHRNPAIPIIGLSTFDEEGILTKALEVGFVSFISKPFENRVLLEAVQQAFDKRRVVNG